MSRELLVGRLGRLDYESGLALQQRIVALRQQQLIPDTLLLLEHPAVITLGRFGDSGHILADSEQLGVHGVKVVRTNRGGDVTFHGPGQLVGYPLLDLRQCGMGLSEYLQNLAEVFVRLLDAEYGIKACFDRQHPGVWIGDRKITAMGCAVQRGVTMHGFAFNVNVDLAAFRWIVPCGLADKGVTSVQEITGVAQDLAAIQERLVEQFSAVFGCKASALDAQALAKRIGWQQIIQR